MFYKIRLLKNFTKFTEKHLCWSLCNLILKSDSSTGVFMWIFRHFFRILFLKNTLVRLLLTFIAIASLIMKYLWDVSTIGCLVFLVISQTNVYSCVDFSHWGWSLFLSTWNLKVSEYHCKHFQLYCTRTSGIFIKMF